MYARQKVSWLPTPSLQAPVYTLADLALHYATWAQPTTRGASYHSDISVQYQKDSESAESTRGGSEESRSHQLS